MPFLHNSTKYWWAHTFSSNWCAVCCGGIGSAAIMCRLEEPHFSRILTKVIQCLNQYLDCFDEEGGWAEGIDYWNYGLTHLCRFGDALNKITDYKLNLFEHPKMQQTVSFLVHSFLPPDGFVNFGDCTNSSKLSNDLIELLATNTLKNGELVWLLSQLSKSKSKVIENYMDLRKSVSPKSTSEYFLLLEQLSRNQVNKIENFRDLGKQVLAKSKVPNRLHRHFGGIDWLITRRSWEDRLGPVLAIKAGGNGERHNQIDVG